MDEVNGEPQAPSSGPLEQFLILSKAAKGLAAVELIKDVLQHPQIFVFAELLDQPSITDLSNNPDHEPYFRLLRLFAFGVYQEYIQNAATLPPLTPAMAAKLRYLTIVSLSSRTKRIPYDTLLKELSVPSLRELEDLIIEMIYANVVSGKMDQQNGWLEIDSTIARDITPDQLGAITTVLTDWCDNCDNVLANIEQQILLANTMKIDFVRSKGELDAQISKVKTNLKTAVQDLDDDVVNSGTPPMGGREMSQMEKLKRRMQPSSKRNATPSSSKGSFWKNN